MGRAVEPVLKFPAPGPDIWPFAFQGVSTVSLASLLRVFCFSWLKIQRCRLLRLLFLV